MRVRCRLGEIMKKQGMTVNQLRARTGLSGDVIAKLRGPEAKNVSLQVMLKICDALRVTLDELFVLCPDDIWAPIKMRRELTIHFGSRSVRSAARRGNDSWSPQFIGSWDLRAYIKISDYVKEHCPGTNICLEEHFANEEMGFNPTTRSAVRDVFKRGNHLILGSPVANPLAELAVCHAYNVSPCAPDLKESFPYAFVWDTRVNVPSSFGWQGTAGEFGIASPVTGEMAARRTVVSQGQGDDCALILVQRIEQSRALRQDGGGDERVIIALLGHTGLGTFAAASMVTDPQWLPDLFPPEQGKPFMRAAWATYNRAPTPYTIDTRELTGVGLVQPPPSEIAGEPQPPRSAAGN